MQIFFHFSIIAGVFFSLIPILKPLLLSIFFYIFPAFSNPQQNTALPQCRCRIIVIFDGMYIHTRVAFMQFLHNPPFTHMADKAAERMHDQNILIPFFHQVCHFCRHQPAVSGVTSLVDHRLRHFFHCCKIRIRYKPAVLGHTLTDIMLHTKQIADNHIMRF